jgi:hypothetical protein
MHSLIQVICGLNDRADHVAQQVASSPYGFALVASDAGGGE